tara:strand:- start:1760 stop:3523 length:1764 start_codon:yes stop_codon:yes gene_type:complete
METTTLHKFSQEEYWTEEYEKFNTLPRDRSLDTNLFNIGTKKDPELVTYKHKKNHHNISDVEWRKLCFSPFVNTQLRRITVVVEKVVDEGVTTKVRISKYYMVKGKKCGAKYFWKKREMVHVTFDLVNNNIYKTTSLQRGRKRSSKVLKNPFKYWNIEHFKLNELESDLNLSDKIMTLGPVRDLETLIPIGRRFSENPKYWDTKNKIQSGLNSCFRELVKELSSDDELFNVSLTQKESILDIASTWFCKVREIKNPDRWLYYFKNNYPGIKPLRKRGNNLIQTILREEGIYSKFAVKLFNTYKDISVLSYSIMLKVLGIELIQDLNPELLREKYHLCWNLEMELSLTEKRNFIGILNSLLSSDIDLNKDVNMVVSDIISDHLGRLKPRLMRAGMDMKLKAKTYEEFVQEHIEWTDLLDDINSSTTVTHIYKKDFLNYIQQPLTIGGVKMTPVVLRDTHEYRDESNNQHNCVKSYVEHKNTCIISLRDCDDNRITNEYGPNIETPHNFDTIDDENRVMTNRQSRGRFNTSVPEDLQPFIELLNLKMVRASKEQIYGKTQVIKECGATGTRKQIGSINNDWEIRDGLPF